VPHDEQARLVELRVGEIDELGALRIGARRQQIHVLGLEVAMHDADLVRLLQRAAQRDHEADRALGAERPLALDHGAQRDAGQVLHHHEDAAVGQRAVIQHAHGHGVREGGERLHLAQQPAGERLVLHAAGVEDLHGDVPPAGRVPRLVEPPHRALREQLDQLVAFAHDRPEAGVVVAHVKRASIVARALPCSRR